MILHFDLLGSSFTLGIFFTNDICFMIIIEDISNDKICKFQQIVESLKLYVFLCSMFQDNILNFGNRSRNSSIFLVIS